MQQEPVKPSEKPFQVWVKGAGIYSGHETESAAAAAASRCNESAQKMALTARYEVRNA
jgi:hypothetical protein